MHASAHPGPSGPAGPARVLIVDDDPAVALLLVRYLSGQGLRVDTAANAGQVRAAVACEPPDAILLDLGLPDTDGLELMGELRRQGWQGAIVVVTGRGEPVERVVGLELGADDYVTKPFELRELLARLRSVLRRTRAAGAATAPASGVLETAGLRVDTGAREVRCADGTELGLSSGEFDLLLALAEHPQCVLSRDALMDALHGRDAGPFDRSIDMRIGRLRRKLGDDLDHPRLIKSVRGAGYMLAAPVHRP